MAEEENRSESVKQCLELLSDLEDLVNEAQGYMFNRGLKVVNPQTLLDKLYTVKKLLPDSVKRAAAIVGEGETIKTRAGEDARSIRETARREADKVLADANAKVQKAAADANALQQQSQQTIARTQQQVDQMLAQAQQQAQQIVQQARYEAQQQAQQIVTAAGLEAEKLKSQEEVYIRAQVDAERIRSDTESQMALLRKQSFDYVEGMLGQVEQYIGAVLTDIHQEHESVISHRT